MRHHRLGLIGSLLLFSLLLVLAQWHFSSTLTLAEQGRLLWQRLFTSPVEHLTALDQVQFWYSAAPRALVTVLVGAALGFSGSLLQQLTQNRLVSPMTLGASSGAWLALVIVAIVWPGVQGQWNALAALLGAMLAAALVMLMAGRDGLGGVRLVLAGMACNLLFGALASGLMMMHDQYTRDLFVWGAGDLTQTDWHAARTLLWRLAPAVLVLWLAPRALQLLRLGAGSAQSLGLAVWPLITVLFLAAMWLTSSAITAVGLIGFIGLLTPNLVRLLGVKSPRAELIASAVLGALALQCADVLALWASEFTLDRVPTGAAAALLGVPVLIWLTRRNLTSADQAQPPAETASAAGSALGRNVLLMTLLLAVFLGLFVSPGLAQTPSGGLVTQWQITWPDALVWSLRWPRLVVAMSAGAGLAVAGVLLQRLLRNPLASPDILGLSAGATLAMLICAMISGATLQSGGPLVAFLGAMVTLVILIWLGRRHQFAPGMMALVGISLAALLDAVLQFVLVKGTLNSFAILGWMAGSTYRVLPEQALLLAGLVTALTVAALVMGRAVTLLGLGAPIASSLGVSVGIVRLLLLSLAAMLCAVVTSQTGPIAFVGLLAPHLARLSGARLVQHQLLLAAVMGATLMLLADWLGRVVLFPVQMPVGIMGALLCGGYFLLILAAQRWRARS
ncbi:Fe(3+)-hydroxamate ABC transporter permease FhuB [Pokkaliibacter sp. CJK22405]|uniref:Fe(3+)-hydroxamate ABC transporter permease FhuB n=1 Tax=Pokkaliibacter sp. CJK22405 TaxID=3384615 RepID=UPI003984F2DB